MIPRRRNAALGATSLRSQGVLVLVLASVLVAFLVMKITPNTEGAGMEQRLVSVNMRRNDGSTLSPFVGLHVSSESVPVAIGDRLKSGTGDIDAQVTLCKLKQNVYFHEPYLSPTFEDLVRASGGCGRPRSATTTIANLQASIDDSPAIYLEPTGFVFHLTPSTAAATGNLLGASPYNLVYTRPRPPLDLQALCAEADCSEEQKVRAMRTVLRAMSKTKFHQHVYFNLVLDASLELSVLTKAFPDTPWLFVYQDPVPSLLWHLSPGALAWSDGGVSCLSSKSSPPPEVAELLGVSQGVAKTMSDERYCAAELAVLCLSVLSMTRDSTSSISESRGLMVEYQMFPNAVVPILREHFRTPLTPAEEYFALQISTWYPEFDESPEGVEPHAGSGRGAVNRRVVEAAQEVLGPALDSLGSFSVERASVPAVIAAGYVLPGSSGEDASAGDAALRLEAEEEVFRATPAHLRGLDRVLDPDAPWYMASSLWRSMPMEEFECPDEPPKEYPKAYPIMDVLENWSPRDPQKVPPRHYLSTCRFDYQRELHKAEKYSAAEKPFILYNIPSLDAAVGRWSNPEYLEGIFGISEKYHTRYSETRHFLFYSSKNMESRAQRLNLTDWTPPTTSTRMNYGEWLKRSLKYGRGEGERWYFWVTDAKNKAIMREMEIFRPPSDGRGNIFLRQPSKQNGVFCRFGMPGMLDEAHFDGNRNMVAMVSGVRRWIIAHPNQCEGLYVLPADHPSERHSVVDLTNPDLEKFPKFRKMQASEVLLKPGEVMYLPTHWIHYLVNVGMTAQCNSRSGVTDHYQKDVRKCGF